MDGGMINIIRLVVDIYATVLLVRLLLQLVQLISSTHFHKRSLR